MVFVRTVTVPALIKAGLVHGVMSQTVLVTQLTVMVLVVATSVPIHRAVIVTMVIWALRVRVNVYMVTLMLTALSVFVTAVTLAIVVKKHVAAVEPVTIILVCVIQDGGVSFYDYRFAMEWKLNSSNSFNF